MYYNSYRSENASRKEKTTRYEALKSKISILESNPKVLLYLKWLSLPAEKKQQLKEEWRVYYEKVRDTKAYKRFKYMRKYFKMGGVKNKKFQLFQMYAKLQQEGGTYELKKPSSEDPYVLLASQEVKSYILAKREKDSLDYKSRSLEYQQAKEIFG